MALPDLDLFGNTGRSGYDDIVRMGPGWWTEYLEMDTNYRYAGWLLDLMTYHLDRVMNNLFFAHADEETIAAAEAFLGIVYNIPVSLDERRATVLAYFSGASRLSGSTIQQLIYNYTGLNSDVWATDSSINARIYCNDEGILNAGIVYGVINRRMPAHLRLIIQQLLTTMEMAEWMYPRVRIRMDAPWWTLRILNGEHALDGAIALDQPYPMEFYLSHRIVVSQTEVISLISDLIRFTSVIPETIQKSVRHRMMSTLFTGFLLDGRYDLDGTHELAPAIYPEFNKQTFTLPVNAAEDIGIYLYLPSMALSLDGTGNLDGEYTLNSGREEL